jgi:hypothetical protein
METESENLRRGEMQRIFPSPNAGDYLGFTAAPRYYNILLDQWGRRFGWHSTAGITALQRMIYVGPGRSRPNPRSEVSMNDIELYLKFTTTNQFFVSFPLDPSTCGSGPRRDHGAAAAAGAAGGSTFSAASTASSSKSSSNAAPRPPQRPRMTARKNSRTSLRLPRGGDAVGGAAEVVTVGPAARRQQGGDGKKSTARRAAPRSRSVPVPEPHHHQHDGAARLSHALSASLLQSPAQDGGGGSSGGGGGGGGGSLGDWAGAASTMTPIIRSGRRQRGSSDANVFEADERTSPAEQPPRPGRPQVTPPLLSPPPTIATRSDDAGLVLSEVVRRLSNASLSHSRGDSSGGPLSLRSPEGRHAHSARISRGASGRRPVASAGTGRWPSDQLLHPTSGVAHTLARDGGGGGSGGVDKWSHRNRTVRGPGPRADSFASDGDSAFDSAFDSASGCATPTQHDASKVRFILTSLPL